MMCHKLPGKSVLSGKQRQLMTEICEMNYNSDNDKTDLLFKIM